VDGFSDRLTRNSSFVSVGQFSDKPGQIHFRISRLESAVQRGLEPVLGLRFAHALAKEIGIAAEVFDRRERNIALTRSLIMKRLAAGNPEKTLAEAGAKLSDIVTITVFLIDARYTTRIGAVRTEIFDEDFPASAAITVAGFAPPEMMIEVQCVAAV
jgi:hypothetical protein